jgi:hypothetical protein
MHYTPDIAFFCNGSIRIVVIDRAGATLINVLFVESIRNFFLYTKYAEYKQRDLD